MSYPRRRNRYKYGCRSRRRIRPKPYQPIKTGEIQSNPLLFPEFQVKLAKFFLDHGVQPCQLNQLLERQHAYKGAKEKTDNLHRLNAFLISEWVINHDRANSDKLAAVFGAAMRDRIEEFCTKNLGMRIEYTRCSSSKSFERLKLFICKKGNLWAVCQKHGTQLYKGTGRWCYGRKYNKETEATSEVKAQSSSALERQGNSATPSAMLKRHSEKLVEVLSLNASHYATALFSEGLILEETFDEIQELSATRKQKGRKLHSVLLDSVKCSTNYRKLLDVLGKEASNAELIQELQISSPGSRIGTKGSQSKSDDYEGEERQQTSSRPKRACTLKHEDNHTTRVDMSSDCTSETSRDTDDDDESFLTGSSDDTCSNL